MLEFGHVNAIFEVCNPQAQRKKLGCALGVMQQSSLDKFLVEKQEHESKSDTVESGSPQLEEAILPRKEADVARDRAGFRPAAEALLGSKHSALDAIYIEAIVEIFHFCLTFGPQLRLCPFTLIDLCKALTRCRRDDRISSLLEELHVCFLRFIAKERRAMDGKINFYNHTLFLDNTDFIIPSFTPEAVPEEYAPDVAESDAELDESSDGDDAVETFDGASDQSNLSLGLPRLPRGSAAASRVAIARIAVDSSNEEGSLMSDREEPLADQPISDPRPPMAQVSDTIMAETESDQVPPTNADSSPLVSSIALPSRALDGDVEDMDIDVMGDELQVERRKSQRSREPRVAQPGRPLRPSKASDESFGLEEHLDVSEKEGTLLPSTIQGAWFINMPTKDNWAYLLIMFLREFANEKTVPGYPVAVHPKDVDPIRFYLSFPIELRILILKFMVDLALISSDLRNSVDNQFEDYEDLLDEKVAAEAAAAESHSKKQKATDAYAQINVKIDALKNKVYAMPEMPVQASMDVESEMGDDSQGLRSSSRIYETALAEITQRKKDDRKTLSALLKEKSKLLADTRKSGKLDAEAFRELQDIRNSLALIERFRPLPLASSSSKLLWWFDNAIPFQEDAAAFKGGSSISLLPWTGHLLFLDRSGDADMWKLCSDPDAVNNSLLKKLAISSSKAALLKLSKQFSYIKASLTDHPEYKMLLNRYPPIEVPLEPRRRKRMSTKSPTLQKFKRLFSKNSWMNYDNYWKL